VQVPDFWTMATAFPQWATGRTSQEENFAPKGHEKVFVKIKTNIISVLYKFSNSCQFKF